MQIELKKKSTLIFIFCSMLFFSFKALALEGLEENSQVLFLTIPKSGTHLLRKALTMITKNEYDIKRVLHLADARIQQNENLVKAVWIRDPRDILISQVFWFRAKNYWWPSGITINQDFDNLSFDEQLEYVINFPDEDLSIGEYVKIALEMKKDPDVVVYRFEDFIGPQGGGSRPRQEESIKALAQQVGYVLSDQEISAICDNLFGNSPTFRQGKIGNWEKYFLPHHKELLKNRMGQALIDLGYAENNDW